MGAAGLSGKRAATQLCSPHTLVQHFSAVAQSLTGALGVHPQVGAELVGAHAWVALWPWQQAGPRGQPEEEQKRQEWP